MSAKTWYVMGLEDDVRALKDELGLVSTLTCSAAAKKNKKRTLKKKIKKLEAEISSSTASTQALIHCLDNPDPRESPRTSPTDFEPLRKALRPGGEFWETMPGAMCWLHTTFEHWRAGLTPEELAAETAKAHRMFPASK